MCGPTSRGKWARLYVKQFALILLLAVTPCGVAPSVHAVEPGDKVDNFALLDHRGAAHELHYLSDAQAIVLMVHGNGCPIVRNSLPALAAVRDRYAERGVEFLLLNSNLQDDRASIAEEAEEFAIDFPILVDETQLIGEGLGLLRTAEVLVIDPQSWTLAYRGTIDDRLGYEKQKPEATAHYLTDALDALLADEPVAVGRRESVGCLINFSERQRDWRERHSAISYAETIAPLLIDNCVVCHREGGIGPWAMTSYTMVRGFAPMIREVVRTRRMPPWHADAQVGRWKGDRSLSIEEVQELVHWIEAGAPRGDGPDPLASFEHDWPEWSLEEPDLIVTLPPFDVPATGVIPYQFPRVANPTDHDVWVRAVEVLPGDRSVVHHVIATFRRKGDRPWREGRDGELGAGIGGYVPGAGPTVYPEDTGVRLPSGTEFVLQMHYTTTGRATSDQTRMGLYFRDDPPSYPLRTMVLLDPTIRIPAHAKSHVESVSRTFRRDALVYSLFPHAHYRGRASEFRAVYPDGHAELLLSVPRYDFNWQHTYVFEEPKLLPAGTRLVHSTTWDNSKRNPANPDPSRDVPWGLQSWDEMLFGSVRFRYVGETVAEPFEANPRQGQLLGILDDNADGLVQLEELGPYRRFIEPYWARLDRDGDGGLNSQEFEVIETELDRERGRR